MSVQSPPDRAAAPTPRTKQAVIERAGEILETLQEGDPANPNDNGHRFCANCFSQIREVDPPKPDSEFFDRWDGQPTFKGGAMDVTDVEVKHLDSPETAKAAIGFATPTNRTENGEIVVRRADTRPEDILGTGTVCECGATSHTTVERPVSKANAIRYARNLSDSVNQLRNEYKLGPASDREEARITEWLHSRELLVKTVRELKEDPSMQAKPIFKAGLAVALRRPNQ